MDFKPKKVACAPNYIFISEDGSDILNVHNWSGEHLGKFDLSQYWMVDGADVDSIGVAEGGVLHVVEHHFGRKKIVLHAFSVRVNS